MEKYKSRLAGGIAEIPAPAWDACAGHGNPFVSHAFFSALEQSGSAGRDSGWLPQHILLEDGSGAVAGVLPLYLKSHSYGEYVFDQGWAEAYARAGGRYYPKLQGSVPFTPVTGPRLMAHPAHPAHLVQKALLAAAIARAGELGVSSLHLTFMPEDEWQQAGDSGLLLRTGQQFHWENRGYGSFADFLGQLASRKRKMIARERREALAAGITIERLTGPDITEAHWDAYYDFYVDTGNRKWGRPYLNREFFSRLGEGLMGRILLVMGRRNGRYVAGALNLIGADSLYGRYWGAIEEHPFLHFEICYYQAIEFAIERALSRVEAGAQGEHKLARGYLPVKTRSAHWIADPGFREAVAHYLERERLAVDRDMEILHGHAPFRHGAGDAE